MIRAIALLTACTLMACMLENTSHAAEKALVQKLIQSVNTSPERQKVKDEQFKVVLERKGEKGPMTLIAQKFADGRRAFAVHAMYVVGAAESNYTLDTECMVLLGSSKGDGIQDILLQWDCIAWTSTMEKFVNDARNSQRVFDLLVAEAGELMRVK